MIKYAKEYDEKSNTSEINDILRTRQNKKRDVSIPEKNNDNNKELIVKEDSHDFIKRNKEDGFILGEVWKNPMRMGRSYIDSGKGMDSVMNYQLVDALIRYFKYSDVNKLDYIIKDIQREYRNYENNAYIRIFLQQIQQLFISFQNRLQMLFHSFHYIRRRNNGNIIL